MILYKFHRYNTHLLEMLANQRFYAATLKELNDPFDCWYGFTKELLIDLLFNPIINESEDKYLHYMYSTLRKKYLERTKLNPKSFTVEVNYQEAVIDYFKTHANDLVEFKDDLDQLLNKRIVSLSKKTNEKDELLMWAHYTNSYNGVKLEFEFDEMYWENPIDPFKWDNINYIEKKVELKSLKDYERIYFTKLSVWKYEMEFRIIHNLNYLDWDGSGIKLTGITFGFNLKSSEACAIGEIASKINPECKLKRSRVFSDTIKENPTSTALEKAKSIDFELHMKKTIITGQR